MQFPHIQDLGSKLSQPPFSTETEYSTDHYLRCISHSKLFIIRTLCSAMIIVSKSDDFGCDRDFFLVWCTFRKWKICIILISFEFWGEKIQKRKANKYGYETTSSIGLCVGIRAKMKQKSLKPKPLGSEFNSGFSLSLLVKLDNFLVPRWCLAKHQNHPRFLTISIISEFLFRFDGIGVNFCFPTFFSHWNLFV